MSDETSKNLLPGNATVGDVLRRLNEGVQGVVFLADDEGRLQGMFTDGDIRRALLGGAGLDAGAAEFMNRKFTTGHVSSNRQENLARLSEIIRHLPIVDDAGRMVDLITWADIWRLPVMEPSLGGNELKYVSDCLASGWISSQGQYITKFEEAFQARHDGLHCLCVSNGTTALHLALVALGIGPGDEVIVPDLTFAASANVVIHCGATPVFVDVTPDTWTMDPAAVERAITPNTRAIMPVHLYGHPADMDPLLGIALKHHLKIIEDAAESLGAEYRGRKAGTIGDVGCFSFFANKIITTGEGGMVVTNDSALHERMRILRDHGMQKGRRYWHLYAGFNYRMTNMQAAIGLAQMEQLGRFLSSRETIVERYDAGLRDIPGITLPPRAEWARNVHWLYSILVEEAGFGLNRDELALRLGEEGIDSRPFFYPLHIQPPYQPHAKGEFPVTNDLAARGLSLPTANDIRVADVERVCDAIRRIHSSVRSLRPFLDEMGVRS